MYSKIKNPLNNQVYSVYSFQGKRLLKQYVKQLSGGSEFNNVPLSKRAQLVENRRRQRRKQRNLTLFPISKKPDSNEDWFKNVDELDRESLAFVDKVDKDQLHFQNTPKLNTTNLSGIRHDLNKLKKLANRDLTQLEKEQEKQIQDKFKFVQSYLEKLEGKISGNDDIIFFDAIENEIKKTKRKYRRDFISFEEFKNHVNERKNLVKTYLPEISEGRRQRVNERKVFRFIKKIEDQVREKRHIKKPYGYGRYDFVSLDEFKKEFKEYLKRNNIFIDYVKEFYVPLNSKASRI